MLRQQFLVSDKVDVIKSYVQEYFWVLQNARDRNSEVPYRADYLMTANGRRGPGAYQSSWLPDG